MSLCVNNISKSYGNKKVVDNLSFILDKPCIFGLLGTNGAGKTTTIRMILNILKIDEGNITWNGKEVDRKKVNFGYLSEERGLYPKSKIITQLLYFAELKGMKKELALKNINKWAKILNVSEYLNLTPDKLSKGNQQKIQFMMAIIHNPDLIVLDEPFSGLDPVNSKLIKEVIINLVKQDKYIIMSAHEMYTIEEFCTDLVILNKGKTVLQGNLKKIRNSYPINKLFLETKEDIKKYLNKYKITINNSHENIYEIAITSEDTAYKLLKDLINNNIKIIKFELARPSLNEIFIEKVGDKNERYLDSN